MTSFGDTAHLTLANEEPAFAGRFCEMYDNFDQRHRLVSAMFPIKIRLI